MQYITLLSHVTTPAICSITHCTTHTDGHDSVQDAAIALELAFLKARMGDETGSLPPWCEEPVPKCSLFEPLLLPPTEGGEAVTSEVSGENYMCNPLS